MGSGKTTAIAAISETVPLNTDVYSHDKSISKTLTTVGMDYGEVTLENGEKLRLYGTPGQQRFDFMWQILAKGALGLVILIDNSHPDPLAELDIYLDGFDDLIKKTGCVVGIGKTESHPFPDLDAFAEKMQGKGILAPVIAADVRDPKQVLQLLDLLLLQLEQ